MSSAKIIRAGLVVLMFIILLATAFLAGMGNTRALQEAAYRAGYEDGRAAGPAAAAAPDRAPETITVIGTVAAVSAQGIDVRDEAGETHSFRIDAETRLVAIVQASATAAPREEPITVAELAVGDAVSVTREEGGDRAVAVVRTMSAAAAEAPAPEPVPLDPPPPEMVQPQ